MKKPKPPSAAAKSSSKRADHRQTKYPNLRAGAPSKKRPNSGRFAPGNRASRGRPPGTPNKATREVKALAQSILEDPKVQARMLLDAQRGRLPPPVMTMLFHYAYGKPKERIEVDVMESLHITITDDIGEDVEPRAPARASDDTAEGE